MTDTASEPLADGLDRAVEVIVAGVSVAAAVVAFVAFLLLASAVVRRANR